MNSRLAFAFVLALSPAALADGAVLVVDDNGGPGVDYVDIQSAVDASAPGDVVLVKAGSYAPFGIVGKGISVVADNEETARVSGQILVSEVPAGELAVLRGLSTSTPLSAGIAIDECAGTVFVEECSFVGEVHPNAFGSGLGYPGARVQDSASVVFVRSSLRGGNGQIVTPTFYSGATPGADGILARRSSIIVVDCTLTGGNGAWGPAESYASGGEGGDGIEIFDTTAWIFGGAAFCGNGGPGGGDFDGLFGVYECGSGGNGGNGVRLVENDNYSPVAPSTAVVRDFTVHTGNGGFLTCTEGFVMPGTDGVSVKTEGFQTTHTVMELAGRARSTYVSSPVRGGTTLRIWAQGIEGDLFFFTLGGASIAPVDLGLTMPLALGPPFQSVVLGVLPEGEQLLTQIPLSPFGPGFGGRTLSFQGAFVSASTGVLELAPPGTMTLLESAY